MKNKIVLLWMGILAVIFVGGLILWKITWISSVFTHELARRKIYSQDSNETRYPGEGVNKRWMEERLWVVPKGVGKPKYVTLAQRQEYPTSEYEVVSVPAQEEWFFTVGKVLGWEEILGSADKYLLVTYRGAKETIKYRVVMGSSEENREETALAVEDIDNSGPVVGVADVGNIGLASEIGNKTLSRIIKRGDVVVILPVWEPPVLAKMDEHGRYLVSWLVVRRVGGEEQFMQEVARAKGGE